MYNIIDTKENCPNCDANVEWQTKDLIIDNKYLVANVLKTYRLNKRMDGEIHTFCDKCKTYSEGKIKNGKMSIYSKNAL